MRRLIDYATILRSKNAGPLYLTFDIMFPSRAAMDSALATGRLTAEAVAELYPHAGADDVAIIPYEAVNAVKITIPRACVSGSPGDDDVYGCQQQGALANLVLED